MKTCARCAAPILRPNPRATFCSRVCANAASWARRPKVGRTDEDRAAQRVQMRKTRYGVTPEVFEQMQSRAAGHCECCSRPFKGTPQIAHSHTTGTVRGLLCNPCNTLVGQLEKRQDDIRRCTAYLRRHEGA